MELSMIQKLDYNMEVVLVPGTEVVLVNISLVYSMGSLMTV